jgi:hypothetical protein
VQLGDAQEEGQVGGDGADEGVEAEGEEGEVGSREDVGVRSEAIESGEGRAGLEEGEGRVVGGGRSERLDDVEDGEARRDPLHVLGGKLV